MTTQTIGEILFPSGGGDVDRNALALHLSEILSLAENALGASSAYSGDLNALDGTALVLLAAGFTNGFTGAAAGDQVFQLDSGDSKVQIGCDNTPSQRLFWVRRYNAEVWGSWVDLLASLLVNENDMVSNSAERAPTQASVKAFVETEASNLFFDQDINGAALVDVTLPVEDYTQFTIKIANLVPGTDGVPLQLRTSSDGTTFDAGASDYQTAVVGVTTAISDAIDLDLQLSVGSDVDEPGSSGTIHILNPNDDTKKTVFEGSIALVTTSGNLAHRAFAGMRDSVESVVAVRLQFGSGVIESGKVQVYGMK